MKRILAIIICSLGLILPCRLRIIYIEIVGWITQFVYLIYFSILKFIVKNLVKQKGSEILKK